MGRVFFRFRFVFSSPLFFFALHGLFFPLFFLASLSQLSLSLFLSLSPTKPLTCAARRRSSGTRWGASRGAGRAKTKRKKKRRRCRTKKRAPPPTMTMQTRHPSLSARRSVVSEFEFRNREREEESLSARGVGKGREARERGVKAGEGHGDPTTTPPQKKH